MGVLQADCSWQDVADIHSEEGRFDSLTSTSGAARLYTVELIMEVQISAARLDAAWSKGVSAALLVTRSDVIH